MHSHGQAFAQARKSLVLTQQELADLLSVSKKTVEAWEYGYNYPSPALRKLISLSLNKHDTPEVKELIESF
jgi:DNA-binding transcriptional regulator YiaG